jgi:hypothetical protein
VDDRRMVSKWAAYERLKTPYRILREHFDPLARGH